MKNGENIDILHMHTMKIYIYTVHEMINRRTSIYSYKYSGPKPKLIFRGGGQAKAKGGSQL